MRYPTIVFAMVAGFFGGSISSHLRTVYAQGPGPGPGAVLIDSKAFVLLDTRGRKRGEWIIDSSDRAVLRMFDTHGRLIWDNIGTPRPQLTTRPQIAK